MRDDNLENRGVEDSARGKANNLKGKVKDATGGLTGDLGLQAEGKADQIKGKTQDAIGKTERKLGEDEDQY